MARTSVRQWFWISGLIVAITSGVFGLQTHLRQVCVEVGLIFCTRYEWRVVGYSFAPWAVGGIAAGVILILLGVALIVYPRLAKEMREELGELREQRERD